MINILQNLLNVTAAHCRENIFLAAEASRPWNSRHNTKSIVSSGLCRTSEIFGASALVVDNIHCISDKQFQYLSVSSEQWVPLVEVKASQLVDYLQQKKTQGYTVIGVEQTAKSIDLMKYTFPEKSLLLLGNEREGIPANLFQHVDVCVEIPQLGIIRSLNVHVSGALLIWEYTKQQITKQKTLN